MKVRWSRRSQTDLKDIGRYIARHNRNAARRWVSRLREKVLGIREQPRVGRIVPELMRDDIREVLLASYRIVYQIRTEDLLVLTVFEGHRLLPMEEPDPACDD